MKIADFDTATGELFGSLWGPYDEVLFDQSVELFERRLRLKGFDPSFFAGKRCLDAGCGGGRNAIAMARLGAAHVDGVDLGGDGIKDARKRGAGIPNVAFQEGSIEALPFADDSFDLVYASHVLEHVPDERGFLAELKRVSRDLIYLEVPCELVVRTDAAMLQRTLDIGHINAYTPESFVLTLATAGLVVEEFELFDHSRAVHAAMSGELKGALKRAVRGSLLKASPSLASKLFCYHCGALCR